MQQSPPEPEVGRDAAIAAIEKAGGRFQCGNDPNSTVGPITVVSMWGTDADLEHLKGLTNLQELRLNSGQVTDAGLEHLKGLTSIHRLSLTGHQVTDAGLEHLKGLTNLKRLFLNGTQVSEAGVNELKKALPGVMVHR